MKRIDLEGFEDSTYWLLTEMVGKIKLAQAEFGKKARFKYWWLVKEEGEYVLHLSRFNTIGSAAGMVLPTKFTIDALLKSILGSLNFEDVRNRREIKYHPRTETFSRAWRLTKRISWCDSPTASFFNSAGSLANCIKKNRPSTVVTMREIEWLYGKEWLARATTTGRKFTKAVGDVNRQERVSEGK